MSGLRGESLTLAYDGSVIVRGLDIVIPAGRITVIVGPNACGKSTLLRALARLMRPQHGHVLLDGHDLRRLRAGDFAQRLGLLPQSSTAPQGIRVAELVARGRFPHQSFWQQWSDVDEQAVRQAMIDARVDGFATRAVDTLSGGQCQRVWLAMALAQQTPWLLLDEPTTWLDIAHQLEVLELCLRLNRERGRSLVMVLHDLNQAGRLADHLIAMKDGSVVATGAPVDIIHPALIETIFGIRALVTDDPVTGSPMVVPIGVARSPGSLSPGPASS